MYFGVKSDSRIPRLRHWLFQNLSAHFPVFSSEKQQRIPFPDNDILHLSDEDRMISSRLRRMQAAFEVRQGSVQDRRSMGSAIESGSGFGFGIFVGPLGPSVILGDGPLSLA